MYFFPCLLEMPPRFVESDFYQVCIYPFEKNLSSFNFAR